MSKPRKASRKTGFFSTQEGGAYLVPSLFTGLGLLLVSALHMSVTGDTEAYYTRSAGGGPARSIDGPVFLYLIGGCLLAFSVLLWPAIKQKANKRKQYAAA